MLNVQSASIGQMIDTHREYLIQATEFAAKQYKQYCEFGDSKLAGKYAILASYMNTPLEGGPK